MVISGEEGIRKPDPRIYALGAERIGLAPEACVFVDDLPCNLKPARGPGMATVHHTDAGDHGRRVRAAAGRELRGLSGLRASRRATAAGGQALADLVELPAALGSLAQRLRLADGFLP